jgi:hypothetical protein
VSPGPSENPSFGTAGSAPAGARAGKSWPGGARRAIFGEGLLLRRTGAAPRGSAREEHNERRGKGVAPLLGARTGAATGWLTTPGRSHAALVRHGPSAQEGGLPSGPLWRFRGHGSESKHWPWSRDFLPHGGNSSGSKQQRRHGAGILSRMPGQQQRRQQEKQRRAQAGATGRRRPAAGASAPWRSGWSAAAPPPGAQTRSGWWRCSGGGAERCLYGACDARDGRALEGLRPTGNWSRCAFEGAPPLLRGTMR